ncbi:MAG TPA: hypothetical protein VHN82_01835 [Methanoregula sp.]|nr:hypothetical protein [Methanoregula sp.]
MTLIIMGDPVMSSGKIIMHACAGEFTISVRTGKFLPGKSAMGNFIYKAASVKGDDI